jgi:tetratricopeptide (TPR) repeat protein
VQERLLGQGAMGAVYLVRDRETGEQLARKKLFRMDGKSALRIKREFRSLADLSHRNLVKVYELGRASDGWFLTMEYIEGEDLRSHLGLESARSAGSGIAAALTQLSSRQQWLDEVALPAFHQLAQGVCALHRAGMLHRDLKPSNVLVASERVVVLDFGLVRELDPSAPSLTEDGGIAGTPAYMAPEQALGKGLSEATDWYAFGAMLYEALTGELPFDGAVYELLRAKLERDPRPPRELDASIPEHLDALCMALLARDPGARPGGSDVLARLQPPSRQLDAVSHDTADSTLQTDTESQDAERGFFGRHSEVAALWAAFREAEEGRTIVAHVRGMSGAGKSALVEQFLDQVDNQPLPVGRPQALVLRSRCYEREAMPFKALDGVVDALSRHLAHANDFEVSNLLPTDIAALVQLFPVLERLRAVQHLLSVRSGGGDAVDNRQRAESALRELFSRIAARRPVVIWIDDLQWGDLDSAGILQGWLQRGVELPLLLVVSYRADEVETSECLRSFLASSGADTASASKLVEVNALAREDVQALCRHKLGRSHDSALIERIVRESQGSPFLAAQLSALAEAKLARGDADVRTISIGDLITQMRAMLPAEARHLLCVLAVAGRPIAPKLALRAARLRRGGRELVHALRRLQLVRMRDVAGESLLEVYHDRVRENVQRLLSASESQQIHGSLLEALEYGGNRADPDWLHTLAIGASQRVAAYRYGLAAAERAMTTLAFERAVQLYMRCIELSDAPKAQRASLVRKLAQALDCAGRGSEAADAYLEAAELTSGADSVALLRLGTSHLLRSGRFEEGETMLQRVLTAMDMNVPRTQTGLLAAIVWERFRNALRGLRYTPRSEAELPAAQLERIEAYTALRHETLAIDPVRAALFHARGLRLALDAGEPMGVLQGLSGMCHLSLHGGARAERRTDHLLEQTAALAARVGSPAARAAYCATRAIVSWMLGRPHEVLAAAYEAEELYRSLVARRFDGSYYIRLAVVSARIGAQYELSEYRAFVSGLAPALQEARATGNRAAMLHFSLSEAVRDELLDCPEASLARLQLQREQLPRVGFGTFHALHLIAVLLTACAAGDHDWALRVLEEDWPRFLRSPMHRAANLALIARALRVRLLLNHEYATTGTLSPRLAREIKQLTRSQLKRRAAPMADTLRARLAHAAGNRALAIQLLERASAGCTQLVDAERARYGLGVITGGERGAALCAEAERTMRERGVVNPMRLFKASFPEMFPET